MYTALSPFSHLQDTLWMKFIHGRIVRSKLNLDSSQYCHLHILHFYKRHESSCITKTHVSRTIPLIIHMHLDWGLDVTIVFESWDDWYLVVFLTSTNTKHDVILLSMRPLSYLLHGDHFLVPHQPSPVAHVALNVLWTHVGHHAGDAAK